MSAQSEGNNHTSEINFYPVLHTIFFLLEGLKMDFFAPNGAIESTLGLASRKIQFCIVSVLLYTAVQKSLGTCF